MVPTFVMYNYKLWKTLICNFIFYFSYEFRYVETFYWPAVCDHLFWMPRLMEILLVFLYESVTSERTNVGDLRDNSKSWRNKCIETNIIYRLADVSCGFSVNIRCLWGDEILPITIRHDIWSSEPTQIYTAVWDIHKKNTMYKGTYKRGNT